MLLSNYTDIHMPCYNNNSYSESISFLSLDIHLHRQKMCLHVYLFVLFIYFGLYATINAHVEIDSLNMNDASQTTTNIQERQRYRRDLLLLGTPDYYYGRHDYESNLKTQPRSIPNYADDNNNKFNSQSNETCLTLITKNFQEYLDFIVLLIKLSLSHLKTY